MSFIYNNVSGGVPYMSSDILGTLNAFTTRLGGVSEGYLSSLNLGENRGDKPENVIENYRRLKKTLGIEGGMVFTKQVHEKCVRRVTHDDIREPYSEFKYRVDGLITDEPELPLIIFTADCTPILFFDPVRGAVGASHAGWRGTAKNIAGETVRRMSDEFGCVPSDIRAAIGPCISRCCFEVGAEVAEAMAAIPGIDASPAIEKRGEKFMVDLKLINRLSLISAGLKPENIDVSEECTYCSHEKYWSHRYTDGSRGTQASVIMLRGR